MNSPKTRRAFKQAEKKTEGSSWLLKGWESDNSDKSWKVLMFNGIKFWQMGKVIVFGAGGAGKRASFGGLSQIP